ncbi:MAG TPA: MFS transporter [Candidatus Acidoferrum sp.]|jgi:DHA3 family macrolide efflux protein-like MFS transporter|nr:MFS transporter [Candidatus Acidoferrum sp.]
MPLNLAQMKKSGSPDSEMAPDHPSTPSWKALFRLPGFPFFFVAMLVSLFGTGMNFAGVTWYVLGATHSTVKVSLIVILVTLPGLVVPPFGGVLIDRVDRRYLGIIIDAARAVVVLGTALLAYAGRLALWELYSMVLLLGVGFAIYWSTTNALIQELVPQEQLVTANATVLIAVQGGMAAAGALVGFIYEHAGLAGILGIDGTTYVVSAICLLMLRQGYCAPREIQNIRLVSSSPTIEAPPEMSEPSLMRTDEAGPGVLGVFADIAEGLAYLRRQPRVLALGFTYACMMAGVISANVLVVALAKDLLSAGARGYGWIEAGWAGGAIVGGLAAGVAARKKPYAVLVVALATLAVGHMLFPYARVLSVAVAMNALFGVCRALGGVLTQTSIMAAVPRHLMGRTQSAFSVIGTVLQVSMSFTLGWFAEHVTLSIAFLLLGAIYGGGVVAALRVRALSLDSGKTPATAV